MSQKIFDKCQCPADQKLVARNTSICPDKTDRGDYAGELRDGVCFYPTGDHAESAYKRSTPSTGDQASTTWAWVSLLTEVGTCHSDCAFGFAVKERPASLSELKATAANGADAAGGIGDADTAHGSSGDVDPTATASDPVILDPTLVSPIRATELVAPSAPVEVQSARDTVDSQCREPNLQQPEAPEKAKNARKHKAVMLLPNGKFAQKSLGQISEYVANILRRQHRLDLFTLYVYAGQAHIIRWDRAGAVISTPFDFEKNPSSLYRVTWRYAGMTREQRGYDPTVVLATQAEVEDMRACKCRPHEEWIAVARNEALNNPGWPVYKIVMSLHAMVDEEKLIPSTGNICPESKSDAKQHAFGSGKAYFIIGRRHFASSSLTGRGTKCSIAYDMSGKRLVFLKDYWRSYIDDKTSRPEGYILEHLRTRNVQKVPTPVAYEDVGIQEDALQQTRTQQFLPVDEKTGCISVVQRHHRLVVEEIGRPLETHRTPRELARVFRNVIRGGLIIAWF